MRDFAIGVFAVGVLLGVGLQFGGRQIDVALPGRDPLEVRQWTYFATIAFFAIYALRAHWVAIGGAAVLAGYYGFLFVAFSMIM